MTPPTVNAYYSPQMNDINFPAGILQPPFYDVAKDPAVNFGGIGVVIGHEMTHGFDDQGSKYGPTGNVGASWFTPEDLAKFNERTSCIADEYSNFNVTPDQKLNGRLTLGENSADNGGIRIAFRALEEVMSKQGVTNLDAAAADASGYTPAQRFFLSFGQVWCENCVRRRPQPGQDGSALDGAVEDQRHGAELRRVRQGIQLQSRAADDADEVMPRLVASLKQVRPQERRARTLVRASSRSGSTRTCGTQFGSILPGPDVELMRNFFADCYRNVRLRRPTGAPCEDNGRDRGAGIASMESGIKSPGLLQYIE